MVTQDGKGGGGPCSPLPQPVTIDQEYLAAILSELRALNSRLTARPEPPGRERPATVQSEPVELTEPARKSRRKGQ